LKANIPSLPPPAPAPELSVPLGGSENGGGISGVNGAVGPDGALGAEGADGLENNDSCGE